MLQPLTRLASFLAAALRRSRLTIRRTICVVSIAASITLAFWGFMLAGIGDHDTASVLFFLAALVAVPSTIA